MNFLNKLKRFFKRRIRAVVNGFNYIKAKIIQSVASLYKTSDICINNIVHHSRRVIEKTHPKTKHRLKKRLRWTLVGLITFGILSFIIFVLIRFWIFIVPAGSVGVVTTFGKATRQASPGLNLRSPYVEKYYIVDFTNMMEETFGFRQAHAPVNNRMLSPEQYQIQMQHLRAVKESQHHVWYQSENEQQLLPEDYLRSLNTSNNKYEQSSVIKNVEGMQGHTETIQQSGVDENGRIVVPKEVPNEAKLITGDLGLVNVNWVLQYTIVNGIGYLFQARDVQRVLRDMGLALMSRHMGDTSIPTVYSSQRAAIEEAVKNEMQQLCDHYGLGLKIIRVIIVDVLPPTKVQPAFNTVNQAVQEKKRITYEAEQHYASIVSSAQGQAGQIIANATAYAIQLVNNAKGEAGRFDEILLEYEKAPVITRQRLYLEAMMGVLNTTPNVVVDEKLKGILPIYNDPTPTPPTPTTNLPIVSATDVNKVIAPTAAASQLPGAPVP